MSEATNATQVLLDRIPDEREIRDQLTRNLREADALRALLRVARKKSKAIVLHEPVRSSTGEVCGAR